jgi:hypothetical protein
MCLFLNRLWIFIYLTVFIFANCLLAHAQSENPDANPEARKEYKVKSVQAGRLLSGEGLKPRERPQKSEQARPYHAPIEGQMMKSHEIRPIRSIEKKGPADIKSASPLAAKEKMKKYEIREAPKKINMAPPQKKGLIEGEIRPANPHDKDRKLL